MFSVSIILPCCNEEDAVLLLPERLLPVLAAHEKDWDVELIFVDDGSTDRTWERLVEFRASKSPYRAHLLRHPANRGLGAAVETGLSRATGDVIVTVDVDGTYPFPIIARLVAGITAGADVATASPYHRDGGVEGVPAFRLLFSRGASLLYRIVVDRHIATYTALVRAYRADVLRAALVSTPGFVQVAMTLVEARRRGARVVEVPAILARRRVGVSKARVARITRAHIAYLCRLTQLRLTGRFWIHPSFAVAAGVVDGAHHG